MRLLGNLSYWRQVSPTGAVSDFVSVWRDNPYRWRVLAVSAAMTGMMLYGFLPKSERAEPRRPQVTYISTFEPGRTDAQIIASNKEAEKRKEANAEIEAERQELRKQLWRELGRATFVDVDAMEQQIAAEKAAEERAAAARATPQSQTASQAPSGEAVARDN